MVQFQINVPCDSDRLAANIAHAMSLGLSEMDDTALKSLTIIANGPSAKLFDINSPGDTLAVNGALKLFTDQGKAPTYWACCDPQALVADFLIDPPTQTIYLVASKCDPLVFQMLQGRDVRLWHIDDHPLTKSGHRAVAVASSVTLCVMSLMRQIGYRNFETYGWDACFEGLEQHAGEFIEDYPEGTIDLCVGATVTTAEDGSQSHEGGRWFKTTSTWAAEAQDAIIQTHYSDYRVTVNGDGLIRAMLAAKG